MAEKEPLNARLEKLIKQSRNMLFMKGVPAAPQCGFSRTCVGLLQDAGIEFGSFNILEDDEVRSGELCRRCRVLCLVG